MSRAEVRCYLFQEGFHRGSCPGLADQGRLFSEKCLGGKNPGGNCPGGIYSVVIVRGGKIAGGVGWFFWGKFHRGGILRGVLSRGDYSEVTVRGAKVWRLIVLEGIIWLQLTDGQLSRGKCPDLGYNALKV